LLLFKELVKTITSDNGKEFAKHQEIASKTGNRFFILLNLILHGKEDSMSTTIN